jgi:hypothetical protein
MNIKKSTIRIFLMLVLCILGVITLSDQQAFAASPVKVCAVSYTDESILVFNNGNSKIYYATEIDAAKEKWDVIEVRKDASGNPEPITVIDISFLTTNLESILMIKGNSDSTQSRVIIKGKPQKLEVSINYSNMDNLAEGDTIGTLLNIMASEGNGETPITIADLQWRKGTNGYWLPTEYLTKELLESYLIKGTQLYFRIAPKDDVVSAKLGAADFTKQLRESASMYAYTKSFGGVAYSSISFGTDYPNGLGGRKASGEVKLKLTKMTTLPVTGIDGEDFKADIKYGQEYRVTLNGGATPSKWTQVTDRSVKSLPLSKLTGGAYDGITKPFPKMLLEIREYATAKTAASKIVATNLDAQRVLSGNIIEGDVPTDSTASDPNIYISYNGTKNIVITIPSASSDNPYEYCVVKQGYDLDLERASWFTISKSTSMKILSSKALDQSTLYIRMKEVKYKAATRNSAAVSYKLASTCKTYKVSYPSEPIAPKMTYVYTKGYPTAITINVTLNTAGKLPYETGLRYIKLGTTDVPVQSCVISPAIIDAPDPNQVYTMQITLSSAALERMAGCTAKPLNIYYNNGTVDKTSSKLTIKYPTAATILTTTAAKGTAPGTTAITVLNTLGTGNAFLYTLGDTEVKYKNIEDTITEGLLPFVSGADIAVGTNRYLTIYELNATNNIIKYKCIELKADIVKEQ